MLSDSQAITQARELKQLYQGEREHLDLIRRYWKGVQRLPEVIPSSAPREVRMMARISRVNVCKIIVDSVGQSLFVDNFRANGDSDDDGSAGGSDKDIWKIWQANKMDARQSAIHRAAAAYGASYAVVLPGKPVPVIRPVSPRHLLAAYEDDPDWPVYALEFRGTFGQKKVWRLYDNQAVYELNANNRQSEFDLVSSSAHGAGVTPVIRYLDEDDLDADDDVTADLGGLNYTRRPMRGEIATMMPIQDQIDLTTFSLKVAEWFSAFRQRYVIGWVPDDEQQKMKASASQLWAFDAEKGEIQVGEFGQTSLDGYIESREASLRHAATLSQTPVHELIGELVNLSAEALAAAEQGHERKIDERKTLHGEAHEQTLRLAGELAKVTIPDDAEVVWRDTSARSFAATVDGLGKLVTMMGVPPEMLWEKIPGVTKQDVQRWVVAAKQGGAFEQLAQILEKQSAPPASTPPDE